MNITIRHMEWLLTTHNCVVVPRLGAVLARHRSAGIDSGKDLITSPGRTYAFNSELTVSDGLLEQSVARAEAISHENASRLIARDVDAMKAQLHSQGILSLGRAGTLKYDRASDVTIFLPFDTDALTPLSSWIAAVPASKTAVINEEPVRPENKTIPVPAIRPWKRIARTVAAVAAVIAVALVSSTPISVEHANYASLALPSVSAPKTAYVPSAGLPVLNLAIDDTHMPALVDTAARHEWQRVHASPAPQAQKTFQNTYESESNLSATNLYYVVVASLANEADAAEFIRYTVKHYDGKLSMRRKGKHVHVYAAAAPTEQQARALLNSGIASTFSGAWICRR